MRGPYGNRYVANLPGGAIHYPWNGNNYWHVGFGWYTPSWVGDSVYYGWAYPPVGFYYSSLPSGYSTTVVNNTTYYGSEGVYYVQGEEKGQKGYVVAEAPAGVEVPASSHSGEAVVQGKNPFEVLKSMCDALAGLEKFSVVANTTVDQVRDDGAAVQFSVRRSSYVLRPDKIAIDVTGDKGNKRFVYDGKKASLYDAANNKYMSVDVPDTIETALDALAREYNVVLPLEDIMYKDLYNRAAARITAGEYLGLHKVGEIACHHLAFTLDAADWELWVDAGGKPLPLKASVSYRQDAARSRCTAALSDWNVSPKFNASTFEFKPPAAAMGITVEKAN